MNVNVMDIKEYQLSGFEADLEYIQLMKIQIDKYHDSILSILGLHETALIKYFHTGYYHVN